MGVVWMLWVGGWVWFGCCGWVGGCGLDGLERDLWDGLQQSWIENGFVKKQSLESNWTK